MRIIQLLPTISFGDAIGNDTITLKNAMTDMGYETDIYAENIDKRLPSDTAQKIDRLESVSEDDVIIYHLSTGTDLTFSLGNYII